MIRLAWVLLPLLVLGCTREPVVQAQERSDKPIEAAIPVVAAIAERVSQEETVPILGSLVAEDRATVASEVEGRIESLLVREGDSVVAGQPIVRLQMAVATLQVGAAEGTLSRDLAEAKSAVAVAEADFASATLEVGQSRARLTGEAARAAANAEEASARLKLLERGARPQELERAKADAESSVLFVEAAKQTLAFAERTLIRRKELFAKGFIAERDLDEAQYDHDQATKGVLFAEREQRAKETLLKMLLEGPLPEEIAQAQAQHRASQQTALIAKSALRDIEHRRQAVKRAVAKRDEMAASLRAIESRNLASPAAADLAAARLNADRTVLRAPSGGIVLSLRAKVGDAVRVGQPVAEISGANALRLEATALSQDAARIRPGVVVRIKVKSLGSEPLSGVVLRVLSPASDEGISFRVVIEVPRRRGLLAGMVASGDVVIGSLKNALTIPLSSAVEPPVSGVANVYRIDGNLAKLVEVRVEETAGGRYRVLNGLRDGEQVVVEGKELLRDGARVRLDGGATP